MFNSNLASIIFLLGVLGVLAGFFRHLLIKVLVIILLEIVVFVLFPNLLVFFAQVVGTIRAALT